MKCWKCSVCVTAEDFSDEDYYLCISFKDLLRKGKATKCPGCSAGACRTACSPMLWWLEQREDMKSSFNWSRGTTQTRDYNSVWGLSPHPRTSNWSSSRTPEEISTYILPGMPTVFYSVSWWYQFSKTKMLKGRLAPNTLSQAGLEPPCVHWKKWILYRIQQSPQSKKKKRHMEAKTFPFVSATGDQSLCQTGRSTPASSHWRFKSTSCSALGKVRDRSHTQIYRDLYPSYIPILTLCLCTKIWNLLDLKESKSGNDPIRSRFCTWDGEPWFKDNS